MTDSEKPVSLAQEIINAQLVRIEGGFRHRPKVIQEKFEQLPVGLERFFITDDPDSFAAGVIKMHTSTPNYKSKKGNS
jgi:hypothetical protein